MNIKELLERRSALLAEAAKPETTAERFAEIRSEVERLNFAIETAQKSASDAAKVAELDEELRAARKPNGGNPAPVAGVVVDTAADQRKAQTEALETRGKALKDGKAVSIELRAVTSAQAALGTVASGDINPAFEQVGTLDKLVNETHLEGTGAEAYKKPFLKTIGTGGITAEGASATDAEPTFGYADINKVKVTAYAEVSEEMEKLPAADYAGEVERAVVGAWYKKVNSQIVNGSGTGELVGIVNTPVDIIEASQRKTIATIDENTLDDIIFDYGGDENVEGDAHLVLNKLTLKEFAKVKGSDKKRAYDIVIRGNAGTINGIPFVCTSNLAPFKTVAAGKPYLLYGKLKGYELTYYTALDVQKSTEYKFKEGATAYKVSGMVGGSSAMFNGFMSVEKAAAE